MSTNPAELNDETREILAATTARIVNRAVERRVERVIDTGRLEARLGKVFFVVGIAVVVAILAGSIIALGWNFLH